MKKQAILAYWIGRHGPLSDASCARFLARWEVGRLTHYDESVVKACIDRHNRLTDILACANEKPARGEGPPEPSTPTQPATRPAGSRSTSRTPIRSFDGRHPTPPADAELHRRIGPTQQYDDEL